MKQMKAIEVSARNINEKAYRREMAVEIYRNKYRKL